MKVIVGLGNPGKDYDRTRHNIGWMLLDSLASRLGGCRFRSERTVEVSEAQFKGEKIYLLKPQTYMNLSGQALAAWFGRFREVREAIREKPPAPPARPNPGGRPRPGDRDTDEAEACDWPGLLVASDDVNLPLGRLRFRPSGSAGGHNGLKDIEKALGGRGYPRLRLGVGAPPAEADRADYVLDRFSSAEKPLVEKMLATAAGATEEWLCLGLDAVRNKYNGMVPDGAGGGAAERA